MEKKDWERRLPTRAVGVITEKGLQVDVDTEAVAREIASRLRQIGGESRAAVVVQSSTTLKAEPSQAGWSKSPEVVITLVDHLKAPPVVPVVLPIVNGESVPTQREAVNLAAGQVMQAAQEQVRAAIVQPTEPITFLGYTPLEQALIERTGYGMMTVFAQVPESRALQALTNLYGFTEQQAKTGRQMCVLWTDAQNSK